VRRFRSEALELEGSRLSERFRKNLAETMRAHGSLKALCGRTGLAPETVRGWIKGTISPTLRSVETVAEGLEVPVERLLA
jgi:transcriptional regulator with XRE-family HTH domain